MSQKLKYIDDYFCEAVPDPGIREFYVRRYKDVETGEIVQQHFQMLFKGETRSLSSAT